LAVYITGDFHFLIGVSAAFQCSHLLQITFFDSCFIHSHTYSFHIGDHHDAGTSLTSPSHLRYFE
jgi:hypothetical protein